MATVTAQAATPAQLGYIRKLVAQRDFASAAGHPLFAETDMYQSQDLPDWIERRKASEIIDWLKTLPYAAPKPVTAPSNTGVPVTLTEGIYVSPVGDIIKLKKSKAGNLYAQVAVSISGERLNFHGDVVNFDYVYTPGLKAHITPSMKMSEGMAQDFALRSGRCAWCRKAIKTASSLKAGVGPVCAKRFA